MPSYFASLEKSLDAPLPTSIGHRAEQLYSQHRQALLVHTDRLFAALLLLEWLAACAITFFSSPPLAQAGPAWEQLWDVSVLLGLLVVAPPIILALWRPGYFSTRCCVTVGQMLFSGLLIHLTGGRIESHFHVFGSLAFLAFYRDWRLFPPAILVVGIDHVLRGWLFPASIFGVDYASLWRAAEHIGWVCFESALLILGCLRSQREMYLMALTMAKLEASNASIESTVVERTAQLEESRREAQAMVADLSSVMVAARMGLWNYDHSRGRLIWSGESCRIFALPEGTETTLETLRERVHPEDLDLLASVWQATQLGQAFSKEFRVLDGDLQRWVWVQASGRTEWSSLCLGTVQDITEQKLLEAQLRQVQKMEAVGLLAGGVAHDFNNMLSIIDGFAQLSLSADETLEQRRDNIGEIRRAVDRSAGLVRQLLAFARKDPVRLETFDVHDGVREALKMLQVLVGENIGLHWKESSEPAMVRADKAQLVQILTNLAVNARDSVMGTGTVTFESQRIVVEADDSALGKELPAGAYVLLRVADNGCGMSQETVERAFEPFYTTKGPEKGSGLGLATVYGIVKQHGGTTIISSQLGQGTQIDVYLPIVAAETSQLAAVATQRSDKARGGETILVVEDEVALLSLIERYLKRAGYTVLSASGPREAIDLASQHDGHIDLLITDIIMPDMDGSLLSRRLREDRPDLPCIFMSGYTASVVLDAEATFLGKPFSLADLNEKVQHALARTEDGPSHASS